MMGKNISVKDNTKVSIKDKSFTDIIKCGKKLKEIVEKEGL